MDAYFGYLMTMGLFTLFAVFVWVTRREFQRIEANPKKVTEEYHEAMERARSMFDA